MPNNKTITQSNETLGLVTLSSETASNFKSFIVEFFRAGDDSPEEHHNDLWLLLLHAMSDPDFDNNNERANVISFSKKIFNMINLMYTVYKEVSTPAASV